MAQSSDKTQVTIVGVKAGTIALFEGVLAGVIGLAVSVLYALSATVKLTQATDSVLAGLTLGVGAGIAAILVVPLVYFGIGWLIGYLHGAVFNAVVSTTSGITLYTGSKK